MACLCVVHHLEGMKEFQRGMEETLRVLKKGGSLFLLYKVGVNDTLLTSYHQFLKQYLVMRVFDPREVNQMMARIGF